MEPTSERVRRALDDHRARAGFGPARKQAVQARLRGAIAAGEAEAFVAELDHGGRDRRGPWAVPAASRRTRTWGVIALALAAGGAGVWFVSARGAQQTPEADVQQGVYGQATPDGSAAIAEPGERARSLRTRGEPTQGNVSLGVVEPAGAVEPDAPTRPRGKRRGPVAASGGQPGKVAAASVEPASTLAAELALLRQARREFAAGRLAAALSALDRHGRDFPRGQLGPERMALGVEVLCALDPKRGLAARESFLREHANSSHAQRVRSLACVADD